MIGHSPRAPIRPHALPARSRDQGWLSYDSCTSPGRSWRKSSDCRPLRRPIWRPCSPSRRAHAQCHATHAHALLPCSPTPPASLSRSRRRAPCARLMMPKVLMPLAGGLRVVEPRRSPVEQQAQTRRKVSKHARARCRSRACTGSNTGSAPDWSNSSLLLMVVVRLENLRTPRQLPAAAGTRRRTLTKVLRMRGTQ